MERECRAWQAHSAAHRLAFERCTDLWMESAGVNREAVSRTQAPDMYTALPTDSLTFENEHRSRSRPWFWAFALGAGLAASMLWLAPRRGIDTYETGVGEQRMVVLQDGTRLSLNTSTRVGVAMSSTERGVTVQGGEALFEVAKDLSRPFVVRAAGTDITATGTAFAVRLKPSGGGRDGLDVMLVEGQVVVRDAPGEAVALVQPVVMMAGERLRVQGDRRSPGAASSEREPLRRDRPQVDQVLAWKRGEAVFDNVALVEALAEMNRYSATPIVFEAGRTGMAELRVSGVFKTGDNLSFAHAVASLHGLAVREGKERWELVAK